jgi:hypothetical protein
MAHRDQKQLLGRHLMQRRALYARAMKVSDVKTALNVLKDEAQLQGLYTAVKNGDVTSPGGNPLLTGPSPISREERFYRTLAAEAKDDKPERRLMEHLTPQLCYRFTDLTIARQMLHLIAVTHAAEMLDHAGMIMMAMWRMGLNDDEDGTWNLIGSCHAHRFKVQQDAWERFTDELGVDGNALIAGNHQGSLLSLFTDQIYELASPQEEFLAMFSSQGGNLDRLPTVDGIVQWWRELLGEVLGE